MVFGFLSVALVVMYWGGRWVGAEGYEDVMALAAILAVAGVLTEMARRWI